jgi:pimeloyl-ACP methyl ester carboxylesterase
VATTSLGGWEEVHTAGQDIKYARFGANAGAPVVVLLAGTEDTNIWPELFDSLSKRRPVYLPDLPDGELSFAPRMRAFLDGLALPRATLVAPAGFCLPAVELARREPHRFDGVVLVPSDRNEERALAEIIAITQLESFVRLLVVTRTTPTNETLRRVREFTDL